MTDTGDKALIAIGIVGALLLGFYLIKKSNSGYAIIRDDRGSIVGVFPTDSPFTLVETQRPIQTPKPTVNDEEKPLFEFDETFV